MLEISVLQTTSASLSDVVDITESPSPMLRRICFGNSAH
uniref:Uncharacterized protein n=1 Tax=Anguilla anguilla TaxID=7936 RepID=A0A0E9VUN3_ANGAN